MVPERGHPSFRGLAMRVIRRMSGLPEDATTAYLYVNSEEHLNAITGEKDGANLPSADSPWTFRNEIMVGVQEPLEAGIDPEPVLRGLQADGYFIWPMNSIEPFGTSQ